ncbi:MAG: hypothetical protein SF162_09185 [bacterium]|nr:hypothetical protein [bacterium]
MIDAFQRGFKRIGSDILKGRNLEAYVVSLIGAALLILDILGDVDDGLKLTVIIAALVVLVFRSTKPDEVVIDLDQVLLDRQSYGPYRDFVAGARELWVYGPSSTNVLRDTAWIDLLENGATVRFLIQNPNETHAMNQLKQQLDQVYNLESDIKNSIEVLRRVKPMHPKLEYRFLPYSPGFSMSVVDPDGRSGHLVIEYFGYQNRNIKSRMHINIARTQSAHWFEYWESQYRIMWESAKTDAQVFGTQETTTAAS